MKKYLVLILFVLLFSCRKEDNPGTLCDTVFFSFTENPNKDTLVYAASGTNFNVCQLVAKFSVEINATDSGSWLHFQNESLGNVVLVRWRFHDSIISGSNNPSRFYSYPGPYEITLFVYNQDSCVDSAKYVYTLLDHVKLWCPNIFSPNNDGVNDIFRPFGYNLDTGYFSMIIKDSSENIIYQTSHYFNYFSAADIDTVHYKDRALFYAFISAKSRFTGTVFNGCTPFRIILSPYPCGDTNLVFPDQIDPKYGNIYTTMEPLCL